MTRVTVFGSLLLALLLALSGAAMAMEIVALRTLWCGDGMSETEDPLHPRCGDKERAVAMPEIKDPIDMEYTQLIHHRAGVTRVLVDPGPYGAIDSPSISLDGRSVWYSRCRLNGKLRRSRAVSCAIERISIEGGAPERLELPGAFNLHPVEFQPGKLVYATNELRYRPSKSFTEPSLQLAVADLARGTHEIIGFLSLGSALHPLPLSNGFIAYSSYESQGYRDVRNWGLWAIRPDGTGWRPYLSAFQKAVGWHFAAELGVGTIAVAGYYNQNNWGFGTVAEIPLPGSDEPYFGSYRQADNPQLPWGCAFGNDRRATASFSFQPKGMRNLFEFSATADDDQCGLGKVSHPGASREGLLVTYAPGPVNRLRRPRNLPLPQMGIYLLPYVESGGGKVLRAAREPGDLRLVLDDPHWNEYYAREVVSYTELFGKLPARVTGTYSHRLDPGEPFGLIGSSSTCHQAVEPGHRRPGLGNFVVQGAALQPYDCASVVGMRLVVMEATPELARRRSEDFDWRQVVQNERSGQHYQERLRILGEVPLYEDGSWLAKVPANMAIGFGPIDAAGAMLATFATWKQVRPGEARYDCGGCHAHDRQPVPFEGTQAWRAYVSGDPIPDVATRTPLLEDNGPAVLAQRYLDVEFADTGLEDYRGALARLEFLDGADLIEAHPELDRRTLYRWISLAAPKDEGGWFRDDQIPALSAVVKEDTLYVGAYDTRGSVTPSVTVDGAPVKLRRLDDFRWALDDFSGGVVVVTGKDQAGNVARLERALPPAADG